MSACNLVNPSCKYAIDIMRYENEKKSERGKKYHTHDRPTAAQTKNILYVAKAEIIEKDQ